MPRILSLKSSLTLNLIIVALILMGLAACNQAPPPGSRKAAAPGASGEVDSRRFAPIAVAAQEEIDAGHIPGAVVLVGNCGRVVYLKAFGQRCIEPLCQPMTVDTIFDIASLTKVVATTTAIMQLSDGGLLSIDAPVAKYWPEFGQNGKDNITLQQLLTHTSGLRVEINPRARWTDYRGALEAIAVDHPLRPPGTGFRYSDVNFIVLGEIVRRVSGQPLEVYCAQKIFTPLNLRHTSFKPPWTWLTCIAPCNIIKGHLRWGEVQDPTSYRLGGVAGHAGVFSTAADLAVFAQMLLNGGESRGEHILSAKAVAAMTKPQKTGGIITRHGLGWDIQSAYSKEFNASFPAGSFGHTGYTGTSIWIEPHSKTYLIILTNRLHPKGKGQVKPLRAKIAVAVAEAVPMGQPAGVLDTNGLSLSLNSHPGIQPPANADQQGRNH
jgi:CubicO group peptidase (beta-lactamase class C family)